MEVVGDTLSFLLGEWALERSLTDHRSGTRGRFEGSATVAELPSDSLADLGRRASYDEVGALHFGTHGGSASRSLQCVRREDATVMLRFTDGRPFVDLDLRSGIYRSVHRCGEDRYTIATVVRSHSEVQEHWRVRGPTKNYDALATLRRVG